MLNIKSRVEPPNQPPLEEWIKEFNCGKIYTRFPKSSYQHASSVNTNNEVTQQQEQN